MPNLFLAPNNIFNARSFDELVKPLAMYTELYNKVESDIGELDTQAGIWENMANEQTDPVAYARYKKYANDLRRQAQLLATSKLQPDTTRNILNLKRRYASEIVPIEQAYAARKVQAEEQRKALLQNPTLLLSRRADATSLDDYLENPQLGYESYSGALLASQVGSAAAHLARQLREWGPGKPLDSFTKTWLQRYGYSASEVAQAINNPDSPKSDRILTSLVNDVVAGSGIPQWADRKILGQAYDYAKQGLWQAVGETKMEKYTDQAAVLAAKEAAQARADYRKAAIQKDLMDYAARQQAVQNGGIDGPLLNPRPLLTKNEIEKTDAVQEGVKLYLERGWIKETPNGFEITAEGKKEYLKLRKERDIKDKKKGGPPPVYEVTPFGHVISQNDFGTDFSGFVENMYNASLPKNQKVSFGSGYNALTGGTENLNKRLSTGIGTYSDKFYDLKRDTGWVQQLDDSESKALNKFVLASSPEGVLKKLTYNGNGYDEETIKKSDFKDYLPVEKMGTRYGTVLYWYNDKTKDSFVTNAPANVNVRVSQESDAMYKEAYIYQQILQDGRVPKISKKTGRPLTDDKGKVVFTNIPMTSEERAYFDDEYTKLLYDADYTNMMYVAPKKTKAREYDSHDLYGGYNPTSGFDMSNDLIDDYGYDTEE